MDEPKDPRVERLVAELPTDFAKPGITRRAPVDRVTEHGRTTFREMDPYLVGAPGLQRALDVRGSSLPPEDANVRHGHLSP